MNVSPFRSVLRVQIAEAVSKRALSVTCAALQRRGGKNTDDKPPLQPIHHHHKPTHHSSPHFGKHGRGGGGSKWVDRRSDGGGGGAHGKKLQPPSVSSLFTPVPVSPNPDDINVGAELTDKLKKQDLMKILTTFSQREPVKALSREHGLDSKYCTRCSFEAWVILSASTVLTSVPRRVCHGLCHEADKFRLS